MKKILGICAMGVIAACGSTDDEGFDEGVSIDELPSVYGRLNCDLVRDCYGDVFDLLVQGEDCQANTETAFNDVLPRIKASIKSGKVTYDGTKLQACVSAARARGCVSGPEPAECTALMDGTVAVGGDCTMDVECKGADTYCKASGTCPGKCAPGELAGAPCDRDQQCADGLDCPDPDDSISPAPARRCAQPAALGADCSAGAPDCTGGLICVGNTDTQPGKCRTIAEAFSVSAGGACLLNGAAFCQADLRCAIESFDPVTQTVTTRCAPPVASGAACKQAYPDVCPFDQYCAVPPNSLDGTCEPKPGNGLPCAARGSDAANICAPGTRCDGGTCRTLQKLGGSCQSDDVCYSESCVAGGCAAAGACE